MKCSEYLWKRIALDTAAPDEWSPEQVTRELRAAMTKAGDTAIVSDTTGEPMSERDALSVNGRNQDKLNEAYRLGKKSLFELVVKEQNLSDDEYEAAKAAEEDSGFTNPNG